LIADRIRRVAAMKPDRRRAPSRWRLAAPFGPPTSSGMLTLHCPPAQIHALATFLREKGADSIVANIDQHVHARQCALCETGGRAGLTRPQSSQVNLEVREASHAATETVESTEKT